MTSPTVSEKREERLRKLTALAMTVVIENIGKNNVDPAEILIATRDKILIEHRALLSQAVKEEIQNFSNRLLDCREGNFIGIGIITRETKEALRRLSNKE